MRIPADSETMMRTLQRHWAEQQRVAQASAARLSSGAQTRAVDDAAGVAIAEQMRSRLDGGFQTGRNAQEGINVAQIADGALASMTELIQRMRVLALQSANGGYDATGRGHLQKAVVHTLDELDAIAARTRAAGSALLDGSRDSLTLQVGAESGDTMRLQLDRADREALGVGGIDISTQENAVSALDMLDAAIEQLSEQRARAAATQHRLERIASQVADSGVIGAAALSRRADSDLGTEAIAFVRAQMLSDVGAGLMAEVHRTQRSVLELLRPLDVPEPEAGDHPGSAPGSAPSPAPTPAAAPPIATAAVAPVVAQVAARVVADAVRTEAAAAAGAGDAADAAGGRSAESSRS